MPYRKMKSPRSQNDATFIIVGLVAAIVILIVIYTIPLALVIVTREGPCPICGGVLIKGNVRTISLMPEDGRFSYFFRVHRSCANRSPDRIDKLEKFIVEVVHGQEIMQ